MPAQRTESLRSTCRKAATHRAVCDGCASRKEKKGRNAGSAVMKLRGMYGETPAERTETASSSSCGTSNESSMLSIGRVESIAPESTHLNLSNHRNAEGKPAQKVVQWPKLAVSRQR